MLGRDALLPRVLVTLLLAPAIAASGQTASTALDSETSEGRAAALATERQLLDELLWGPEVQSQRYESRLTHLWDELLRESDKLSVLARFPFSSLTLGSPSDRAALELDITRHRFGPGGRRLDQDAWGAFVASVASSGYALVQTEWHHSRFAPPEADRPARSRVAAVLHLARVDPPHRVIVDATLDITWRRNFDADGQPRADSIRVVEMEILERQEPAAFREVFQVTGTAARPLIHPVIVYDLDKDGHSEVIVGGQNLVIRNSGAGQFNAEQLLAREHALYDSAVVGDFNGDGLPDLVAVDDAGLPLLFVGDGKGGFEQPPIKMADVHLAFPKTFTAGDIDGDDDLDLFIANYKFAYRQGQMPTPYYDANDGYPAYLLRNEGKNEYSDITEQAGLAAKRFRRAYSSSFVDLDADDDLDLIVVSDYSGFDTFMNAGDGTFVDATKDFGLDRHFFGMGHTFGDYDGDGRLDFYVIGMSSTTARRLEDMGVGRDDKPVHTEMRKAMGYGNRMFLGGATGFSKAPFNDQVARTGWSWGASSFDFDNDGDEDVFVANGHYSGKSTQDYCTSFWRHDIYEEGREDRSRDIMFQSQTTELRRADISWNGYEHKVMLMNRGGGEFVNIAFLLGIAHEYDGRGVVSEDLDGDGRVDLLVVEFKTAGLDENHYVLHIYQNRLDQAGNWVGVKLQDGKQGFSPIGAKVFIKGPQGAQLAQIVTGDSFSTQHSATAHFGLGRHKKLDSIEVRWPNGRVMRIDDPAVNRYHTVGHDGFLGEGAGKPSSSDAGVGS